MQSKKNPPKASLVLSEIKRSFVLVKPALRKPISYSFFYETSISLRLSADKPSALAVQTEIINQVF